MTSDKIVDGARAVRQGEELDVAKLTDYLAPTLGPFSGPLTVEQFPSGHSNLTYLIKAPVADAVRELVLRRPPFGSKVKSAHDMGREVRILSKLSAVYPPAPKPLVYCDDEGVLGAPFYVMERIRGIILRRALPPGLTLDSATVRRLCEHFIDNLAALHKLDYAAAGLSDLGKPAGYVERQVSGWTKRYHDARTDEIADFDRVQAWLAAHLPPERGAALIHNDYKLDNVVLDPADPTRIIGVLDWEMSTLGDPLMDLGTTLGYWVQPDDPAELRLLPFGPTNLDGSLTRRELAERYAAKTGTVIDDLLFYYVFALWKTAVVAQQIYYRYAQGLTKDERFAAMIFGVKVLLSVAAQAIDRDHV